VYWHLPLVVLFPSISLTRASPDCSRYSNVNPRQIARMAWASHDAETADTRRHTSISSIVEGFQGAEGEETLRGDASRGRFEESLRGVASSDRRTDSQGPTPNNNAVASPCWW
jgi:hypothetical protein